MRLCLSLVFLSALLLPVIGVADSSCTTCHDFGDSSPVHPLAEDAVGEGCIGCHGASETHQQRPTMAAPDISYGPRWTATVSQQDAGCIDCHAEDAGSHWQDSLHMANNLGCVACHDIHQPKDAALIPKQQVEVCGVCHKPQKSGVHALHAELDNNPPCTQCHNPHADQSPAGLMLQNRSAGCRSCHDLVAMATDPTVTDKATSYHKVMVRKDRSCLDCHQGVAHGPPGEVEPFIPEAVSSNTVTLFAPGQSDIDWILSEHPGAQPFRQGTNCQQCHRGEEATMGAALDTREPSSRSLALRFRKQPAELLIDISWTGAATDTRLAMMWGDNGNSAFRRGGCWAACHSDMPGMSRDRGLDLGKYLSDSRSQVQRIGMPPQLKSEAELQALIGAGNYVDMIRIDLKSGRVDTALLLSEPQWRDSGRVADVSYDNGRWSVTLVRPLSGEDQKNLRDSSRYTFGLALHSEQRSGANHWVSLPMTFSADGNDSDFRAE